MAEENNQGNQDPALAVNMDALSAPEGGYNPFIHGDGSGNEGSNEDGIPGGDGIPDGLPNLDGDPNGSGSEPNGDGSPNDPNLNGNGNNPNPNADPSQGQQGNQGSAAGDYWMKPFEQLKAANPEWDIPAGINEQNYLEVLQNVLNPKPALHPEIEKLQKAIDAGTPFESLVERFNQQTDTLKLDDRELLTRSYKEAYKDWSDDKVKEVLDKMDNAGLLEIEAGKLRSAINYERTQLAENARIQNEHAQKQQSEQINQERTKQISESLDVINKAENIYGLEFSQAEKQEFGQYFAKMVTPDETGMAPLMQALEDNETLVKIAAMMWKGDDKIRSAITNAKESGKQAVLGKLDPNPQNPPRGGNQNDPTKIDYDALSAPERIF
jgi:hypothetical protein